MSTERERARAIDALVSEGQAIGASDALAFARDALGFQSWGHVYRLTGWGNPMAIDLFDRLIARVDAREFGEGGGS